MESLEGPLALSYPEFTLDVTKKKEENSKYRNCPYYKGSKVWDTRPITLEIAISEL